MREAHLRVNLSLSDRRNRIAALLTVGILTSLAAIGQQYTFQHFAGTLGGPGAYDSFESQARFNHPAGITIDEGGILFVCDEVSNTIRTIAADSGSVKTFAGLAGGDPFSEGARAAGRFASPQHVTRDGAGNLYVADGNWHRIRKITATGVVTTFAGSGVAGSANGTGAAAEFSFPAGIVYDPMSGNLFVTERYNHTIRKITADGVVSTLAGLAGSPGSANGTGPVARFYEPDGIAADPNGNLWVADTRNHTIRKITPGGAVSTLAGAAGVSGFADGTGSSARFYSPAGIAFDASGVAYVADSNNNRIRKITAAGVVTTLAGGSSFPGWLDGPGSFARFAKPRGIVVDSIGNSYVADSGNHVIRKITPAGYATTIAGAASQTGALDALGTNAGFRDPAGAATDPSGNLFVADKGNHTIRKITPEGAVTTFAGSVGDWGSTDGTGSSARFTSPHGVASDAYGNVYVSERDGHRVRKITPAAVVTTLAGSGSPGSSDGPGAAASFSHPEGIAAELSGNIYVADHLNHTIRKVTPAGVVTTLAGNAGMPGAVDGTGPTARFAFPAGVAVDASGNVYVADQNNHAIRKVTPAGDVTTLAGKLGETGGEDGTGSAARFSHPRSIALDASGNLYVGEFGSASLRRVTPAGVVTTIAGHRYQKGTEPGTGEFARFAALSGLAVHGGTIFVVDGETSSIRRGLPAFGTVATIDAATGPVGVPRQLSASPDPGTSRIWTLVRRPSLSTQTIATPLAANPTFTPDIPDTYVFRLLAHGPTSTSITTVSLTATCWSIALNPTSLPNGLKGTAYSRTITASGGQGLYAFTVASGALPTGLTISAGGVLSGTPTASGDYSFTLRATDSWGCSGERAYSLHVAALLAPTHLVATWGPSGVSLTWNAVTGAAGYRVYRYHAGGHVVPGTAPSTAFTDVSAGANTAYLYRIRALDGAGFESADSNSDLAATFTFTDPTLVAGSTVVKAVHVTQLRSAVNAVRSLAGLAPSVFTDPTLAGVALKSVHLTQLRTALNQGRAALGLVVLPYTDSSPTGVHVKAVHLVELRSGVQ